MKNRLHRIANFFAFNLLFFALYLNFIHKDKANNAIEQTAAASASINKAVLVKGPEKAILNQQEAASITK